MAKKKYTSFSLFVYILFRRLSIILFRRLFILLFHSLSILLFHSLSILLFRRMSILLFRRCLFFFFIIVYTSCFFVWWRKRSIYRFCCLSILLFRRLSIFLFHRCLCVFFLRLLLKKVISSFVFTSSSSFFYTSFSSFCLFIFVVLSILFRRLSIRLFRCWPKYFFLVTYIALVSRIFVSFNLFLFIFHNKLKKVYLLYLNFLEKLNDKFYVLLRIRLIFLTSNWGWQDTPTSYLRTNDVDIDWKWFWYPKIYNR